LGVAIGQQASEVEAKGRREEAFGVYSILPKVVFVAIETLD
jgi:hypothetical protein